VAFPTETVYGLGADALNPRAVARVFEVKGRPRFDPLIVHIAEAEQVHRLVTEVPPAAAALMRHHWPGPLTCVLPRATLVPDIVTAGLDTVAIRLPDHPVARALITEAGTPLAAPSANRFGHVSPTDASHVRDELAGRVDLVLDGGPCPTGVESTVISFRTDPPTLLRPGGLPRESIERLIGPVKALAAGHVADRPAAPGMTERHYAPRTPLLLAPADPPPKGRVGWLRLTEPPADHGYATVEVLSSGGDLVEAAARLFAAIRRLDEAGLDAIVAEPVPDHGLGLAINDRLRRAAHRRPATA
jgi:L-threonylcarbamoyladenylate synthase